MTASYTRKVQNQQTWFYRRLYNNPKGDIWFILRESGLEFEYDISNLKKEVSTNLRSYEKSFFRGVIRYGL